jgi:DNA-directed RNA polymerase specialized sigma24 family protein
VDNTQNDGAPLGGAPKNFDNCIRDVGKRALSVALSLTKGNRSEAKDLVQEATLRAREDFACREQETSFQIWFLRILLNAFLDECHRQTRREKNLDAYGEKANSALTTTQGGGNQCRAH